MVPLKWLTGIIGFIVITGAIVFAVAVPSVQAVQQTKTIHSHYWKAYQAATPLQFAEEARNLNQALVNEGMAEGNVSIFGYPQDEMGYIRGQILLLAERAEALSSKELTSTEVNTGLAEIKHTLLSRSIHPYGYWLWRQGGVWYAFYTPVILFELGIISV